MSDRSALSRVSRRSQGLTPLEQVLRYHQETKHQFMRYARSLGFLDWANQPDPFRRYAGAPLHRLPILPPEATGAPLYDDLFVAGRIAPRGVTIESISRFVQYALSITAWKQAGNVRWALRSNPSSGNLHPTEGYLVFRPLPALADEAGVYHYAPKEHALERRASVPADVAARLFAALPAESVLFGLSSIHWREAWKYGERAYRYCQHDVGHAIGTARMAAASLGWRMVLLSGLSSDQIGLVLGLSRAADYAGAERELAGCLAVVWPDHSMPGEEVTIPLTLDAGAVESMAGIPWYGQANRLSPELPATWDIIDEVTEATLRPVTEPRPLRWRASVPVSTPSDKPRSVTAHQIIHRRRSAVAFDGTTSITAGTLYHMLSRLMARGMEPEARQALPWDVGFFSPKVHLVLFVHLVEGINPGLYCLARDATRVPALKAGLNPTFSWVAPPDCPPALPFYCLAEGDCRRLAAQLSCHQEIAGASAFALGMLAEFEEPLRTEGPGLYPQLFWECGLIGQVLYLEAEAAGVRATGIGCYFDDPVHEVLGLCDLRFQILYHFTIGGAVEDARLTTLAPYESREG